MKFKTDNLVSYEITLIPFMSEINYFLLDGSHFGDSVLRRKRAVFDKTLIPNSLSISPQNYLDIIKNSLTFLNRLFAESELKNELCG